MRGTRQVGGTHYGNSYDLCDLAADTLLPSHQRDLMKYYWRHSRKNGLKDVEKAVSYLDSIVYNRAHSGRFEVPVQPCPWASLEAIHGSKVEEYLDERLHHFLDCNDIRGKEAGIMTIMFRSGFVDVGDELLNAVRHELQLTIEKYKEATNG